MVHKFKDVDPFSVQREQEAREKDKGKIFTIRLNEEEVKDLKADMKALKQVKPSTTLKQLWRVGRYVLHDKKTGAVIQIIMGNDRRNDRSGITDLDPEIDSNVTQNL